MKSFTRLSVLWVCFLTSGLLVVGSAEAISHRAMIESTNECSLIPPNNQIHVLGLANSGITEKEFNEVLDKVEEVYRPIFEAKGGKLYVERDWRDDTVNAYASRYGNEWYISMSGGLGRHPEATVDAFAIVACHELGHHVGGIPKRLFSWASVEGQADYYATLKCMRKAFTVKQSMSARQSLVEEQEIDPLVKERCEFAQGRTTEEYAICVRSAAGGMALGRLIANLKNMPAPQYNTPDLTVVPETDTRHPNPQCRLDTYLAGAVCPVEHTVDVSDTDVASGTCMPTPGMMDDPVQSANNMGIRSACWFKAPAQAP